MRNPIDFKKLKDQFSGEPKVERLPCTHEWNLVSKTYAPPRKDVTGMTASPQTLEKALFGLTTYLWECRICSALRKEEMLGSDVDQLQELYEKIEKSGMQFLKDGDNVYAITKWIAPAGDTLIR